MLSSDDIEAANTSATGISARITIKVKNIMTIMFAALPKELSCGLTYELFLCFCLFTRTPPHTSALSLSIFFVMMFAITRSMQPTPLCRNAAADEKLKFACTMSDLYT